LIADDLMDRVCEEFPQEERGRRAGRSRPTMQTERTEFLGILDLKSGVLAAKRRYIVFY
jgi:hypothetical protein